MKGNIRGFQRGFQSGSKAFQGVSQGFVGDSIYFKVIQGDSSVVSGNFRKLLKEFQ